MRRELIWVLSAKLIALGLLWLLFFSGAHRWQIGPAETERHLGVSAPAATAAPATAASPATTAAPATTVAPAAPAEPGPDPRSRPQERTGD